MTTLLNQDPPSGTRLNGLTPDSVPLPILPDSEPDFWKRYSPRHEFPLSLAASVVLHVVVGLFIVAVGVLMFQWNDRPTDVIIDHIFVGEGPGPDGSGKHGGRPEGTEPLRERITNPGPDEKVVEPIDLAPLLDPSNVVPVPNLPKRPRQPVDQFPGKDPNTVPGKPGPGSGGGNGGPGDAPAGSKRGLRIGRWTISIAYADENQLMSRLTELQVVLMVPEGDGRFRLWDDLTNRNDKGRVVDLKTIGQLNRIWFTMTNLDDRNNVGLALNLTAVPRYVALFIPNGLELELLKKELAYRGLTEDQINKQNLETTFDVHRRGSAWEVRVVKQAPKGK